MVANVGGMSSADEFTNNYQDTQGLLIWQIVTDTKMSALLIPRVV
jgi:hypothetical protein